MYTTLFVLKFQNILSKEGDDDGDGDGEYLILKRRLSKIIIVIFLHLD